MFNFHMDCVSEIKSRLPIEELVGQYCALKKKGRGFVCVCPFHNDTHPSMQVSPDKGIAYCFACSSGGDVFSFYQKIEGVDFRQALSDLGQRTGVAIEGLRTETPVQKDHKQRLRECLEEARKFYADHLKASASGMQYLQQRGVPPEQCEQFSLGLAPDSFSDTYQHLLKAGFSRKEIVDASLGIQKDLHDQKIYDRFRNRLMFPIDDGSGLIVGFGGRTLAEDDAKYINSGESPLYDKSSVLYGLTLAKESIRKEKKIVLVEGYFDVLACNRIGIENVVAVSGTALTEKHVKIIKRYAETVVLCLDQDRAGREAAERAFFLCSEQELSVHAVELAEKDPDEAAAKDPEAVKALFMAGGKPYLDIVLRMLKAGDIVSAEGKRSALKRILPLLKALPSSVERGHYLSLVAAMFSTTEVALQEDIQKLCDVPALHSNSHAESSGAPQRDAFTCAEIALGILLMFPNLHHLLGELIEPDDPFAACLYQALKAMPGMQRGTIDALMLPAEYAERASILLLFCEHHGFSDWSESMAAREVHKNCAMSNREFLRRKQVDIADKLRSARQDGNVAEESRLSTQFEQVLKLAKMAAR